MPGGVTFGDLFATTFVVGGTTWAVWKIRAERRAGIAEASVKLQSVAALVTAGSCFAAVAIAMLGYAILALLADPMGVFTPQRGLLRFGSVHHWSLGLVGIQFGLGMAFCSSLMFGKLRRTLRARPRNAPEPVFVPPAPPDPIAARSRALAELQRSPRSTDELTAIAREFLRTAYGAPATSGTTEEVVQFLSRHALPAAQWKTILDALDVARYSTRVAAPGLEVELQTLIARGLA